MSGLAAEYPSKDTLSKLDAKRSLPENVEILKKAGIGESEISKLLSDAITWWDDYGSDTSWISDEKAARAVKEIEFEAQVERRALWIDTLTGETPNAAVVEKKGDIGRKRDARIQGVLDIAGWGEYKVRSSTEYKNVTAWATGLDLSNEERLVLAQAELKRSFFASKAFQVGMSARVGLEADGEEGELTRIETVRMTLDARKAATYLRRADSNFAHWIEVMKDDFAVAPEAALKVYALKHRQRLDEIEAFRNPTITQTAGRRAIEVLKQDNRNRVRLLLGEQAFDRFIGSELGGWLRE